MSKLSDPRVHRVLLRVCDRTPTKPPGFSSLETVISTLLVSITLVASMNSLAFVIKTVGKDSELEQASQIAHALLSRMTALPFRDPVDGTDDLGLEPGESSLGHEQWNDFDDYHGWSVSQLPALIGSDPDWEDWAAQVQVNYCDVNAPETISLSPTSLKRIMLRLTSPAGREFVYLSLRCEAGVLQVPTGESAALLSHVNLRIRTTQRSYTTGTRLHNQQVVP